MKVSDSSRLSRRTNNTVNETIRMSQMNTNRQQLIKSDYQPINSSHKLRLLLTRSLRYSYRQRCCSCCPTILCEILFPLIIIGILCSIRFGINKLEVEISSNSGSASSAFNKHPCSQTIDNVPVSSKDIFRRCFKFPPSYGDRSFTGRYTYVSNYTDLIFQPISPDVRELVERAEQRLKAMNCTMARAWLITMIVQITLNSMFDLYLGISMLTTITIIVF
jgi:hypothetical protein